MAKRITSAIIMLPLLILLYFGGLPLYICEFILIVIAMHEFYGVFNRIEVYPNKYLGYIFAIFLLVKNILKLDPFYICLALLLVFFIAIFYLLIGKNNIMDFSITILGLIYVAIFFDSISMLYDYIPNGEIHVWLIFLISFGTDIFAYFAGVAFGKHKLIPSISPKKTIEGSIGGILASIVLCLAYGFIIGTNSYFSMLAIGFFGSIVSQIGDLFASSIKRYCKVKDYGNIIPGHGGILDRFDSVIMTAPVIFALAYIFM